MKFLTYEDIIEINKSLIKLLDKHPARLWNPGNLKQLVEEARKSGDIITAAAIYFYELNRKHVFDGANKRTSFLATDLFLEMNGKRLSLNRTELIKLEMEVRAGRVSFEEIKEIFKHQVITQKKNNQMLVKKQKYEFKSQSWRFIFSNAKIQSISSSLFTISLAINASDFLYFKAAWFL